MKHELSPSSEDIKELRMRHRLTQKKLAESLYGIKADQVANWESGRRNCQPITWWAMKIIWDKEDIWTMD